MVDRKTLALLSELERDLTGDPQTLWWSAASGDGRSAGCAAADGEHLISDAPAQKTVDVAAAHDKNAVSLSKMPSSNLDTDAVTTPMVSERRRATEALSSVTTASPAAAVSQVTRRGAIATRGKSLVQLAEDAAACTACSLHKGRTKSVFARGSENADIVFVGEGPGYNEDQQGAPFVGQAGQLLDKMIAAMKLSEQDVYICNVVKCRPPNNRTPKPDEAITCLAYLEAQLAIVKPKVIVALGRTAAEHLKLAAAGERGWRGRWADWNDIPAISTYHPAFLLRSPQFKRAVWDDLKSVMKRLSH